MKNERIGNDISIAWTIRSGGEPYALEGKDITLYLHNPYGKEKVEGYSVNENVISWTFLGKNQKVTGKYSLILVVNEGENGMITTDSCDFVNLVPCSCQAGGEDNDGVQTEVIELTSEISIGVGSYDDTEIREELSRLETDKADKSELTELSEEVSGLSERVDNLPTAESSVFEAIYGTTTYDEIIEAYNAKKHIIVWRKNRIYNLSYADSTSITFSALASSTVNRVTCKPSGWVENPDIVIEQTSNKVTSLSDKSTDTQYPSAKAVYDLVQQSGTPSGDPMHYMFEAVGAEYNDTGADITRTGTYGDTIVWKAGYWWLNELGDISNEEMRQIYAGSSNKVKTYNLSQAFCSSNIRTNITIWPNAQRSLFGSFALPDIILTGALAYSQIEIFSWHDGTPSNNISSNATIKNIQGFMLGASHLTKILGVLAVSNLTSSIGTSAFREASSLKEIRLFGIIADLNFANSSELSYSSISFLIANSKSSSKVTLTLHATALANAEAAYLADGEQDHTTYPTLSDWALSKNIQIATA